MGGSGGGSQRTVLAAFAHPDDEVGCAGTLAAHCARGDRVVLLFMTRGEMTEALGPFGLDEIAARRTRHAHEVAEIIGAEARLLDLPDTRVERTADAIHRVGRIVAEVRPDAVITWGDAWKRGMRHPDHQATGEIVRGAITIARIARAVHPLQPHRGDASVFTLREEHSTLPELAIDVSPHLGAVRSVAAYYRERVGWPDEAWLEQRLSDAGARWGVAAAELFDAWETPGGLRSSVW